MMAADMNPELQRFFEPVTGAYLRKELKLLEEGAVTQIWVGY